MRARWTPCSGRPTSPYRGDIPSSFFPIWERPGRLAPIPALLAVSGLHQHLVRQGTRTKASIVVQTGEARETHHVAALVGFGADAVYPALAI